MVFAAQQASTSVYTPSNRALSNRMHSMNAAHHAMMTGYVLAAESVPALMSRYMPGQIAVLRGMQRRSSPEIFVVDGPADNMHYLLEAMSIPYAKLPLNQTHLLNNDLSRFSGTTKLLVNSGATIPPDAVDRVINYVFGGGLLMTSDMGLSHVVHRIFPDLIDDLGKPSSPRASANVTPGLERNGDGYGSMLTDIIETAQHSNLPLAWPAGWSVFDYELSRKSAVILGHTDRQSAYRPLFVRMRISHGSLYHMSTNVFLEKVLHRYRTGPYSTASEYAAQLELPGSIVNLYGNVEAQVPQFTASVAANTMLSMAAFMQPVLARSLRQ